MPPRGDWSARARRVATSPFDALPFAWAGYRDRRFIRNLADVIDETAVDLIHCDHVQVAHALPASRSAPRVIDAHNVEHVLVRRLADNERRPWRRAVMTWQARKTERTERVTYAAFDHCLAVSGVDRAQIEVLAPVLRVSVVPNGVDVKAFAVNGASPDRNLIVFVGSMDWAPNAEAVTWFVGHVLPRIRARRPATRFLVVGRRPSSALVRAVGGTHVAFTGTVDDVRPFVGQAGAVVVPLLSGSGTRLKILESWAMGKAVVSTRVGAEGLPAVHAVNVLLADDPEEFTQRVTHVLDDEQTALRLGREGRKIVEEHFSWERVGQGLLAVYSETVRRAGRAPRES